MIFIISLWSGEYLLNIGEKVNILSPSYINSIDVDNSGNVFISLLSSYTSPYLEVYFAKLKKNGSIEYFRNVSRAGSIYSQWAGFSSIIFSDSCIFLIWDDRRISYHDMNFQNEIFLRRYYQNISGGVWGGVENVTENDGNWSINPSCIIRNNKIYVVWKDTKNGLSEVFFRYLQNGIWSNIMTISESNVYAGSASIGFFGNNVFIAYEEAINGKIVIRCMDVNNMRKWIISDTLNNAFSPSSGFTYGKFGIVWNEIKNGRIRLIYREYDGEWKPPIIIRESPNLSEPSLDISDFKSFVWVENGDIFYIDDNLSEPLKMNVNSYYCSNPLLKKDLNGNIFVFWNGYISGSPDKKIFYRIFDNGKEENYGYQTLFVRDRIEITGNFRSYAILSIDGRKIKEERLNGESVVFDFREIPCGLYFLLMEDNKEIIRRKIVHIR